MIRDLHIKYGRGGPCCGEEFSDCTSASLLMLGATKLLFHGCLIRVDSRLFFQVFKFRLRFYIKLRSGYGKERKYSVPEEFDEHLSFILSVFAMPQKD